MSNPSRKKLSTFSQRLSWLLAHEEMWLGQSVDQTSSWKKLIIERMRADGLVGKTTYWCDCSLKKELVAAQMVRTGRIAAGRVPE